MNTTQHTSHQYNVELEDIRSKLMAMGGLVEKQVANATAALLEHDSTLAEQVAFADAPIDQMERELDDLCADVIARRQPTASDLRLLLTVVKVVTDLERIGDEAEKIARYTLALNAAGNMNASYHLLRHLAALVNTTLNRTLDALARMDVQQALDIALNDDQLDNEFDSISRQLYTLMLEDPRNIKDNLNVTWCARSLERIGDHCKNICEYVVYLVKGKDIRHTNLEQARDEILGTG